MTKVSNEEQSNNANVLLAAGWISVEDKLPYKDGDSQIMCLVYDKWQNEILVRPYNEYHKCWDDEDKDDFYTKAVGGHITHWMDLPCPPACS